jgi:hypothetical protein
MKRLLCITLLLSSMALAAQPGRSNISITTIIADLDPSGLSYDVTSDGSGLYADNVAAVTTLLTPNVYNGLTYGDWQFDTYSSTTRRLTLTFSPAKAAQPGDPAYTAPANPPFWGTSIVLAHIEDKCTFVRRNMLTMTAGSRSTCPLIIRFPQNSRADYRLYIAQSFTGYSETSDVQLSCNSADSAGCNDWYIDPIPVVNLDGSTSPGRAVGRLVLNATSNKPLNEGDYYIQFHLHLTRP